LPLPAFLRHVWRDLRCSLEDVADFGQEIVDNIRDIAQNLKGDPGYVDPDPYQLEGDVPYIVYPDDDLSGMIEPYEETLDGEIPEDQVGVLH